MQAFPKTVRPRVGPANHPASGNAGSGLSLRCGHHPPGVPEPGRYTQHRQTYGK
jgi:hypothetical protein